MFVKWLASILVVFFLAGVCFADSIRHKSFTFNETMQSVGSNMSRLFPLMFHEDRFVASENRQVIRDSINNILSLLKNASPHFNKRAVTFSTSYDLLLEHLEETRMVFEDGNLVYAQSLLKEAVSICSSCHTQDTRGRTLFGNIPRSRFQNDFEYAEFSFMTRNYPGAIEYYDSFLNSPHKEHSEKDILTTLKRELTVFAQVYNLPGKGADHFNLHLMKGAFSPRVTETVMQWVEGLRTLEKSVNSTNGGSDFSTLEKLVRQYLGPQEKSGKVIVSNKVVQVYHVWLRGIFYRYLNNKPEKDEIPKLLYWLSLNDRVISYIDYYSLADLYLRECMLSYSRHPYAKLCYEEYKENVELSYPESKGIKIPEEIMKDLKLLHNKVNSN